MSLDRFVTHYARGEAFRSVTGAGPGAWGAVVARFTPEDTWGTERFLDPHYLPRRWAVEAVLRQAFVAAGGRPVNDHPTYAVLGRSPRWEPPRRPGLCAHIVPIEALGVDRVGFTFGDSLLTFDPDYRAELLRLGRSVHPLAGRVFTWPALLASGIGREHQVELEAQLWVTPDPTLVETVRL